MTRVSEQVARAKAHARPWRSIIAAVLAIIAGGVGSQAGTGFKDWTGHGHYIYKIVAAACIAAFFVFGTVAVVGRRDRQPGGRDRHYLLAPRH